MAPRRRRHRGPSWRAMPAAVCDRGSGRGIHFRSLTVRPTSESCVAAGKPGPSLDGRPAAGEDAVGVGLESGGRLLPATGNTRCCPTSWSAGRRQRTSCWKRSGKPHLSWLLASGRPAAAGSPCPAGPAPVGDDQVRPRAGEPAGLAHPQPGRVPRCQPRPVPYMMPGTRVMLVEMAAFPATLGPQDLPAAQRGGPRLLSGRFGEPVVCHLPDLSSAGLNFPLPARALTGMGGALATMAAARHRMRS